MTKKVFYIPLSLLLAVFLLFSMIGCNTNEEEPFKADVKITVVNANNEPIVDTFVSAMKKIGLISDTHGVWDDALRCFLDGVDEIWHAGDFGNIETADAIARQIVIR